MPTVSSRRHIQAETANKSTNFPRESFAQQDTRTVSLRGGYAYEYEIICLLRLPHLHYGLPLCVGRLVHESQEVIGMLVDPLDELLPRGDATETLMGGGGGIVRFWLKTAVGRDTGYRGREVLERKES